MSYATHKVKRRIIIADNAVLESIRNYKINTVIITYVDKMIRTPWSELERLLDQLEFKNADVYTIMLVYYGNISRRNAETEQYMKKMLKYPKHTTHPDTKAIMKYIKNTLGGNIDIFFDEMSDNFANAYNYLYHLKRRNKRLENAALNKLQDILRNRSELYALDNYVSVIGLDSWPELEDKLKEIADTSQKWVIRHNANILLNRYLYK